MTKAQVEKHYDVIRWFLDNPDKGVLYKYNSEWKIATTPLFDINTIYVQNDEYAELRKALANGKTIEIRSEDDGWRQISNESPTRNFVFPVEMYRIKSELDWRDAFIDDSSEKVEYSCAKAIRINEAGTCIKYKALCAYVSKFELGGFWYDKKNGLLFVTKGSGSDPLATYDHAMEFVKEFNND